MVSCKKYILFWVVSFSLISGVAVSQVKTTPVSPVINFSSNTKWDIHLPVQNTLTGYLGSYYLNNLTKRLLQVDEQALLDGFINRPGKHRWIGEHVGKYLESAANTWYITKDVALKSQMDRMVNTLISTQLPDGYLGTYDPANYWTSWDVWSHKYDLVGLLAYYRVTGNNKALDAAKKVGDLLCRTFGEGVNQRDIIKSGTHVGMAATSVIDPMVDLYTWTGDKKYLDFCHYIIGSYNQAHGPSIIQTLIEKKQVNKVANAKAYEMLSNLVGILKLYRITGEDELFKASEIAFNDIVTKRLYVTGTTSDHERFQEDNVLNADTSAHMGEGCVTVTWLQFNMQLFAITGNLKYYNEIEKTVYNHLLGAENPATGCVSYYTPLSGVKPYSCNITCCLSSVPRGISLIPYLNYGRLSQRPTILLYESAQIKDTISTNDHKQLPINLNIKSQFPEKGSAVIEVNCAESSIFEIQLRVPVWSKNFRASVSGKTYAGRNNELITIKRMWKKGDKITVSFEIPVTVLNGGFSYPGYVAIKRGPQILMVDQSLNPSYRFGSEQLRIVNTSLKPVKDKFPPNWLGTQAYELKTLNNKNISQSVFLVPYSDGGQTGGYSSVWILAEQNKNK